MQPTLPPEGFLMSYNQDIVGNHPGPFQRILDQKGYMSNEQAYIYARTERAWARFELEQQKRQQEAAKRAQLIDALAFYLRNIRAISDSKQS